MKSLWRKENWPTALVLGLALIVYLVAARRGWDHELTDSHSSRQAQTAITAQMLHDNGLDPLAPMNGLGPPWQVPMEFPTYQLLTAGTMHLTGAPVVPAGRLMGVLGTLVLLPGLWLLLGRIGLPPLGRALGLALLLTSPLWMHFSRSVLIESWAAALALWWLVAAVELLDRERLHHGWLVAAVLLSLLAALTKVTSFAIMLPPVAVLTIVLWRRHGRSILIRATAATLPGIVAAIAWNHDADIAKAAHPYARFLASDQLTTWNWGTLAQRLDPTWLSRIAEHVGLAFPLWSGGLLIAGFVLGQARERLAIVLTLIAALTGPLAFANLYFVHNYYLMAAVPALAVAVTVSLFALFRWIRARHWSAGLIVGSAAIGLTAVQITDYSRGLGTSQVRNQPLPELGLLLRELTDADEGIVIFGHEWDPLLTYTIGRPVAFVRETYETDNDAWQRSRDALTPRKYRALVAFDSAAGDLPFITYRASEIGLVTTAAGSTDRADIYLHSDLLADHADVLSAARTDGRLRPNRPDRMPPGETRVVFVNADWRPLDFAQDANTYALFSPLPAAAFTPNAPADIVAWGQPAVHIHPPGGLRWGAVGRERTISFDYGLRPEVWQEQHDSDGVRYRLWACAPDGRQHLLWSDWVQPLSDPTDRDLQHAKISLPANHTLELWIDAGPDHNPGFDWSAIAKLRVE